MFENVVKRKVGLLRKLLKFSNKNLMFDGWVVNCHIS